MTKTFEKIIITFYDSPKAFTCDYDKFKAFNGEELLEFLNNAVDESDIAAIGGIDKISDIHQIVEGTFRDITEDTARDIFNALVKNGEESEDDDISTWLSDKIGLDYDERLVRDSEIDAQDMLDHENSLRIPS